MRFKHQGHAEERKIDGKVQHLPQIFGKKYLYFGNYHTGKTYMSDIVLTLCISRKMYVKAW